MSILPHLKPDLQRTTATYRLYFISNKQATQYHSCVTLQDACWTTSGCGANISTTKAVKNPSVALKPLLGFLHHASSKHREAPDDGRSLHSLVFGQLKTLQRKLFGHLSHNLLHRLRRLGARECRLLVHYEVRNA